MVRVGDRGATDPDERAVRPSGQASSHKTRVAPVKIIVYDDLLRSHAVKGIGFRGECSCDWKGPRRKLHSTAAADAHWHGEAGELYPEGRGTLR